MTQRLVSVGDDFTLPPAVKVADGNLPDRLLDSQLNTTYVPRWKPNTAYLAGDKVLSPNGDVVSAIANFTSGTSYNAANWNLSPTYAGKAELDKKSGGQASRLITVMRRGTADAVLSVLGDSTGNETVEWVYLTTQWLATTFPAYTVIYRLWNDTNQSYDPAVTIQTGTGPRTLTVYNGSVSGASHLYPITSPPTRLSAMIPAAPTTVIVSYGYNSTDTTYDWEHLELSSWVFSLYPNIEYVVTSQPPKATANTDAANHLLRQQSTRDMAARERWGLIDVTQPFIDYGNYDTIINADLIHPLAAGQALWVDEVKKWLSFYAQRQTPVMASTKTERIFIGPTQFVATAGTPVVVVDAGTITPKLAFDGVANEAVNCNFDIPASWQSVNIDLLWASAATATGAVVWEVGHFSLSTSKIPVTGRILGGAQVTALAAISNSGTTALRVARALTRETFSSSGGGRPISFRVRRLANDAADTSTDDAYLYGVMITRAS